MTDGSVFSMSNLHNFAPLIRAEPSFTTFTLLFPVGQFGFSDASETSFSVLGVRWGDVKCIVSHQDNLIRLTVLFLRVTYHLKKTCVCCFSCYNKTQFFLV